MKLKNTLAGVSVVLSLLWMVPSVAQPDKKELKTVMEFVAANANGSLSGWMLERLNSFKATAELRELRKRYLKDFDVANDFFATTHSFNYRAYDGNYRFLGYGTKWFSLFNPYLEKLEKSAYLIHYPRDRGLNKTSLLAPLRIENDLIIFLSSPGADSVNGTHVTMPADYTLSIAIRLDDIENPNDGTLTTEDMIRYSARLSGMNADEMNKELSQQMQRYAGLNLLPGGYLNFDRSRLNLNLVHRDFQAEVLELVRKAAEGMPILGNLEHKIKHAGGSGYMRARDGRQYFIQTIFFSQTVIDEEVDFVHRLLDPRIRIKKQIMLPTSLAAAKITFAQMRAKRATSDAEKMSKDAINAVKESDTTMRDLMAKLRRRDQGDCEGSLK